MALLLIWIGLMGVAGNLAAWFLLSRFAPAFFNVEHWTATGKGRVVRIMLAVFVATSTLLVLLGFGLLLFKQTCPSAHRPSVRTSGNAAQVAVGQSPENLWVSRKAYRAAISRLASKPSVFKGIDIATVRCSAS